jgi:hypothetical protein
MKVALELINQMQSQFMNKQQWRKRMASLSFSQKIRILEKLRERSLSTTASGLRKNRPKGR